MKKRFSLVFVLVALILLGTLILSSCGLPTRLILGSRPNSTEGSEDAEYGDDNTANNDNNQQGGQSSDGNVIQNTIVIEGESTDVSYAAAAGLRSSVSILAEYPNEGYSAGSGVVVSYDNGVAYVITNYHVVYHNGKICSDISVFLFGMQSIDYAIPATYLGGSAYYDIAVLRIENSSILNKSIESGAVTPVKIADSDTVAPGNTAIAIGAPGVADDTVLTNISVTSGVVSVASEYITMSSINGVSETEFRVIRIDTAVNSGNSGGGLFNAKGELVGIVNAKIATTDVENIAYAIPSNVVKAVCANIIDYCEGTDRTSVMRAIVGITVAVNSLYTEYDEESGYVKTYEEIMIQQVTEGSLADGLFMSDDVIKSIQVGDRTVEVKRMYHLIDTMLYARVGDKIIATVIRDGKELQLTITITEDCLTEY